VTELLIRPAADAFMQVGVYVAIMVAAFGWLRWRYGDRITEGLTRRPRLGPLVGALLGVSPGCGGAIVLMPLYARGTVSYGTVVAALAATMGDSSWVVLAWNPAFALRIHLLLFVVGLVTGYVVDALGIDPARAVRRIVRRPDPVIAAPAGGSLPATVTGVLAPQRRLSSAFWGLTAPAFVVSVPVVFQAVDPAVLTGAFGGVDPYLALGAVGTAVALVVFLSGRGRLADDSLETVRPRPLREVLRHSAHEASFVTVWVAVAYVSWQAVTTLTGFDGSELALAGVVGVLVGALVGLVPGCAIQIVFTGLYVAGGVPLPTLIANAVSQDGDALIPLAALRPRAAATATVITTVPAIVVGLGALAVL
jgi:hypothetical protein